MRTVRNSSRLLGEGGAWSRVGVPGPGGLVSQHAMGQTPSPPCQQNDLTLKT